MPTITRFFVRTALLYLLAGLLLGGLLASGALPGAWAGALGLILTHLIALGWATQLIFGVALWMFPLLSKTAPRGDGRLGWACYLLLNAGLLTRAVAEPAYRLTGVGGALLPLAAAAQVLAAWLFIAAIWPRVRARPGR